MVDSAFSLFLALVFLNASPAEGETVKHNHPGAIVEYETFQPLSVEAHAYPSVGPVATTTCPSFGVSLHDTESSLEHHGKVTFVIPGQTSSYGAVFCRNGYRPRIEPNQDNTVNGSPIRPVPIQMYPLARRGQLATDAQNELAKFISDLRYLRSVEPEAFDQSLREWGARKGASKFIEEFIQLLKRD